MHIHGTLGWGDTTFTDCLRSDSRVFPLAEMLVADLMGFTASQGLDPVSSGNGLILEPIECL